MTAQKYGLWLAVTLCLHLKVYSSRIQSDSWYSEDDFEQRVRLDKDLDSEMSEWLPEEELEDAQSHSISPALSKLLMNNLHTPYMTTNDMYTWRKTRYNGWSSILSAEPLKKGFISEITVLIVNNHNFLIGCAQRNDDALHNLHIGGWRNSVGYNAANGWRHIYRGAGPYAEISHVGDLMSIRVDLTEGRGTVEFLRNGRSLGLAYAGLFDWDEVYFGMSLHHNGSVGRIVDFKEYKK